MADILVKVESVRKKYCRSLRRSLWYGTADILSEVVRAQRHRDVLRTSEFWALDDVSFELRRGDSLGLIGRNGAGKTTLLKLLNGLIQPDAGRIEIRGRVGALVALGAGFNPLLTGRENIYVNGAVLGLTKREIEDKLEEIISFADIGDAIEAPVQSYSSGMAVRLGFAVAAATEPDVLLLDEVLAVGDAGFRARCYARIADLRRRAAVIFVSHEMAHVARLCQRTLLLRDGRLEFLGDTPTAVNRYAREFDAEPKRRLAGTGVARVRDLIVCGTDQHPEPCARYGSPLTIQLHIETEIAIPDLTIDITFHSVAETIAAECNNYVLPRPFSVEAGKRYRVTAEISEVLLNPGVYHVGALLLDGDMIRHFDWSTHLARLTIYDGRPATAPLQMHARWSIIEDPFT
jgi:lipopolysaccharide transport system ATP-binding protein